MPNKVFIEGITNKGIINFGREFSKEKHKKTIQCKQKIHIQKQNINSIEDLFNKLLSTKIVILYK